MTTSRKSAARAMRWLEEVLAAGKVDSRRVKEFAEAAAIGQKPLRTARERLGVLVNRHGHGTTMRSDWSLQVSPNGPHLEIEPSPPKSAAIRALSVSHSHVSRHPPEMLEIAMVSGKAVPLELTTSEEERVEGRLRAFMSHGLDAPQARDLAVRLVLQRDRTSSKCGSCAECQCYERGSCQPGSHGHTEGPRDLAAIWPCWCARRI